MDTYEALNTRYSEVEEEIAALYRKLEELNDERGALRDAMSAFRPNRNRRTY